MSTCLHLNVVYFIVIMNMFEGMLIRSLWAGESWATLLSCSWTTYQQYVGGS